MDESQTMRVTVEDAARLLGIEKGSVKKRIQRGKLRAERDARGATWVYVDRSETVSDESQGQSATDRGELVEELRDRVRSLERRMDEEREARRRADTIIAQLTQANAALAARVPELEAPSGPPGGPETATEQPGRGEPQTPLEGAQEPRESSEMHMPEVGGSPLPHDQQRTSERPWWRRIFGG